MASWLEKLVENGEFENGHSIVSPRARDSIAGARALLASSGECAPSPGRVYMPSTVPPSQPNIDSVARVAQGEHRQPYLLAVQEGY